RLPNDDDEAPLQWLAVYRCDQRVKQIILVLRYRSGACRLERLHRRHQPAYRNGIARRIDEAKRIQTMEHPVAKPGCDRLALDDRQRLHGFRMAGEKAVILAGSGFFVFGSGFDAINSSEK